MALTRYEQETIVNFNADDKNAEIYTADPVVMRRLDRLCHESRDYTVVKETATAKWYKCPKKLVAFRKPRIITAEQQKRLSENAKKNFGKDRIEQSEVDRLKRGK